MINKLQKLTNTTAGDVFSRKSHKNTGDNINDQIILAS